MASTLTDALDRALLTARKAGDRPATAALRTALAALANATAVALEDVPAGTVEADRRLLAEAEQRGLVLAEVDDLHAAAAAYDGVDPGRAADARAGAALLQRVLAETA
jgi:hypothetical protein